MGKASAPPAPNYGPVAAADQQAADQQFQLGEQQLQWGQTQFNDIWPYAQQFLQSQVQNAQDEANFAQQQQQNYTSTYLPIEQQFAKTAQSYNSPAQAEVNASAAETDVANQFNQNRNAAMQQLESYGIDPSQTRFGALDLASQVSQAAATAASGTQSRLNTQATGLALQGEAINIGRGYPNAIAQAYSTATGAGAGGLGGANSTYGTGAGAMGNPTQYMAGGNAALGNWANTLNMGYNNALGGAYFNAQQNANMMSGLGQLVGGGMGMYALGI